jgi:hypothetical protein
MSKVFINRAMLKAARQFLPYVGYGLYVGRKPKQATRSNGGPA